MSRLRAAYSGAGDLTDGTFSEVLPEPLPPHPSVVSRLILCQGKTYYDLAKAKQERGVQSVALLRIEQLYPFPAEQVRDRLEAYGDAERFWVQEEPENMGAWRFVQHQLSEGLGVELTGVTR